MADPTANAPPALHDLKHNIGVYTNPEHKLWVASALPAVDADVQAAGLLQPGEVLVHVRSTGICG